MDGPAQVWGRLFASLKLLGLHLAEAALLRGRLISLELAEERRRLFGLLGWFTATAFFAMMAIIIGTFFVIAYFWQSHPVVALGTVAGVYAILAVIGVMRLNAMLENLPGILDQTLRVLEKDYQCWANKENDL